MDEAKDKKEYELAFLVKDEAAAQDVAVKAAQYGMVTAQGSLKHLAFAYPVEKETSGYFGFLRFHAVPESAARLEKDFQLIRSILRLLVLSLPSRKEKPADAAPAAGVAAVRPRPAGRQPGRAPRALHTEANIPGAPLTNEALEKKIEEILQ
jgi:ribosomal protein S6